jgi:hypothetical protein
VWAILFAIAVGPASAQTGTTQKPGEAKCEDLTARIVDAKVTEGCTSPNKFCAAGTVTGDHGLNGTTYFRLDGVMRGLENAPASAAGTTGILTYTTSHGTLTVRESGLSGLGEYFTSFQEFREGTGDFAGVTGHAWVLGHKVGDHFDSKVIGVLCRP